MPVDIRDEGQYERFETTKEHEILVLNGEKWFSLVEGQAGEIIVLTDADHQKDHTLQKGRFYLVDFDEDPEFRDMPHLFLETDGVYEEVILPQSLPTQSDKQKKVIRTDETVEKEELEDYLRHPAPAGPGEARMERPGGGSLSNVTHFLKGIDLPADRDDVIGYAKEKEAPQAVLDQLGGMPNESYQTMADITGAVGEGKEPLPLKHYDDLSASDIVERLDDLDENELRRLKKHEEETLGRKTILRTIDEKLKLSQENIPIDGYEKMAADEITDRLNQLEKNELQTVREHETEHKNRKTVLKAIDRQLS